MAIKQDISVLLMKKMDRKDFLKNVGIAVITATGFGAIVKVLAGTDVNTPSNLSASYGGSAYGGSKER